MQRFEFRMEKLLQLRATQRDIEKAKLQPLYREQQTIARSRAALLEAGSRAQRDVREQPGIPGAELAILTAYKAKLGRELAALERRSQACERNLERQRQRTIEAERAVRLLERWKQRLFEEWRYALDQETENQAAEAHLQALVRRRITL